MHCNQEVAIGVPIFLPLNDSFPEWNFAIVRKDAAPIRKFKNVERALVANPARFLAYTLLN